MHHTNALEEIFEPCLIEVRLIEEPERGGHSIFEDDIRGESSISHTKGHRLPRSTKLVHSLAQPYDFLLFKTEDVATGEVQSNGRGTGHVQLMLYSVGRGIQMSELLCVPAVLIYLFIVVDLIIKGGIVDMQFMWVDPDERSYLYSAHTQPSSGRIYRILHVSSG